MKPRLRVGVIGCGVIAQVMHLPYLRELSESFEIAAICDISPTALRQVGDMYGVEQRYSRWDDLIAQRLDAVMVITPGSHAPAAVAAAEAGSHVFVEKPMCLSVHEGWNMISAAERAGVRLMVGYMKRYDPAYEKLAQKLPEVSDIRLVRVTTLESPLRPYVAHYPLTAGTDVPKELLANLQEDDDLRVETALGAIDPELRRVYRWVLLDSLVHELNCLRGLLGEPDRLEVAHAWSDGLVLMLIWGSIRCVVQWVDLPGIARYEQEFAFYSPDARLTLRLPSPFLRSMPTELVMEGGVSGTADSWRTDEIVSYEEAFKRELVEFYECIVQNREPRTSGIDGLHDVALSHAVVEVARTGSPIDYPSALDPVRV
jgi:predicted dehydrogenase